MSDAEGATPRDVGVLRGIPRLILGDHGFLRKYGSQLPALEIRRRMEQAVAGGISGLSAGDVRVLTVATAVAEASKREIFVLHHTDVRFTADGRRANFGRCMSTIAESVAQVDEGFLRTDPLMGAFLAAYKRFRPYSAEQRFRADGDAVAHSVQLVASTSPSAISIGGDYLDVLTVLGRLDAARDAIEVLAEPFRRREQPVILTSYVLGVAGTEVLEYLDLIDAVMVPVNPLGHGMCPSEASLQRQVSDLGKPLIAMHALAAGRIQPVPALTYVLGATGAHAAVVGASSPAHIDLLADALPKLPELENLIS